MPRYAPVKNYATFMEMEWGYVGYRYILYIGYSHTHVHNYSYVIYKTCVVMLAA